MLTYKICLFFLPYRNPLPANIIFKIPRPHNTVSFVYIDMNTMDELKTWFMLHVTIHLLLL